MSLIIDTRTAPGILTCYPCLLSSHGRSQPRLGRYVKMIIEIRDTVHFTVRCKTRDEWSGAYLAVSSGIAREGRAAERDEVNVSQRVTSRVADIGGWTRPISASPEPLSTLQPTCRQTTSTTSCATCRTFRPVDLASTRVEQSRRISPW